ncbi:MAG: hypothetical protein CVV25_00645 [Ignavibacteriae bacterium HGW-Ignavibacteriae-4]|nr:MAG: hypothetical protein CVV25_00645 [Ignavibacteriae bacterium HGW-Ignavibacteriae-4]
MIYPAQLNVFGSGLSPQVSYKYDRASSSWKKHFNIYDHLGTLVQTYKKVGIFGITPTSMQTHNPYGGERWTNSNLTETESTLQNWVGKEKDNESKLGDHGVRKYEYETGRFISIDPLWTSYYGWTPYQYSANNPINNVDVNGKAFITDHILMDQIAHFNVHGEPDLFSLISQLFIETVLGAGPFYDNMAHLDNLSNEELAPMLRNGEYKNWDNHQDQDFYYHSNYIEIMMYDLDYKVGEVPIFESLKPGSSDYEHVLSKIRTTNHPSESGDNVSHDKQNGKNYDKETFQTEGSFYAKDKTNNLSEEAFRLGVKATEENLRK